MEVKLYTTLEAAQELSVSDSYIRKLIARGQAHPQQKIGGIWLFTKEEINRLRTSRKARGRPAKQ